MAPDGQAEAGPPLVDLAPRILYLAGHFMAPPHTSGSSRPLQLARRMVADGHQVTLVSTDAHLRAAGLALADIPSADLGGVEVRLTSSDYSNDMSFGRRKVEFANQALRQAAVAVRGDHDLVYATSTPLTVLVPALARRSLRRTPFAFEVRDVWPQAAIELGALGRPWQQAAAHRLADTGYRRAVHVIALSEGMRDMVVARGIDPAKVTVAHNAASIQPDRPGGRGTDLAGTTHPTADPPLDPRAVPIVDWVSAGAHPTLYAGSAGIANDVGWLVDVVEHLDPAVDLRLAIVAAGSALDDVRHRIAAGPDHVRTRMAVFDAIPKGALLQVVDHVDLGWSTFADRPSLATNSPNKVFDTWSRGVPVAINNDGWLGDELERHGAGISLPRDPARAATQLATWLADETAVAAAGRAARRRVAEEYNWDHKYHDIRTALAHALWAEAST